MFAFSQGIEHTMPLLTGINPEWKPRMQNLRDQVIRQLGIGTADSLELNQWEQIKHRFNAYQKWRDSKPHTGVKQLSIARVRELLASDSKVTLAALLAEDLELAPRMKSVDAVEKLARVHRDLVPLLDASGWAVNGRTLITANSDPP